MAFCLRTQLDHRKISCRMAHTHKTSRVVGYARESVVQHQREALARPWRRPNGSSMHRETQALVERDAWIAG